MHKRKSTQRRGKGLVNSIINKLPVELHIPGYQYCGPGTKLKERLARGDPGINPLDAACKEHDIAYSKNRDNFNARHAADRVLTERAWKRVLAKDASLGEKAASCGVANTMKAKTKLGMKVRRKRKPSKKGLQKQKKVSLRHIVGAAKASRSPGVDAVRSALKLRVKLSRMQVEEAESDHRACSLCRAKSVVSFSFLYHSLLGLVLPVLSPVVRQVSQRP